MVLTAERMAHADTTVTKTGRLTETGRIASTAKMWVSTNISALERTAE